MVAQRMAGKDVRLHAAALAFWMGCAGAACAQDAREEFHIGGGMAESASTSSGPRDISSINLGSFASIDVSAGRGQRARRSLRFRFDSATRAMRSFGVEAEDCATVVRSSRHRSTLAGGGEGSSRLKVSFALSCRFF